MEKQSILDFFYEKFTNNNEKNHLIPKKIHQIWLGDIPQKVLDLSDRIKNLHPEWEYKLWGYSDVETFNLKNKDLFYSLTNRGAQSDIFRYEILQRYGGIYLDTDFYLIKSFDNLLNFEFFSGNGADGPEVFNGLFGCVSNHPILNNVINILSELNGSTVRTIDDVMFKTGPFLFADEVFKYLSNNLDKNCVVLPRDYFYSFPAIQRHELRSSNYSEKLLLKNINDKSICVHLWENSWQ